MPTRKMSPSKRLLAILSILTLVNPSLESLIGFLPIRSANTITLTDSYKVVCYLESWAIYRAEPERTSPSDVDPFGCTHVIFAFLGLDNSTFTVKILDPDYEIDGGGFKSALALKETNPDLKVMIAIGGWAEGGKQYSDMVSMSTRRSTFINSIVNFLEAWPFDGIDIDWEYPGSTDRDGNPYDKENFTLLIREMSSVFKQRGWLLSAAIPASVKRIDDGFDAAQLTHHLDLFNVMTYDMHGEWDDYVDHHAPLFKRPFDVAETERLHVDGVISHLIHLGVQPDKLILGIPFYGRGFTLADVNKTQPRAPISGAGKVNGDYYYVCKLLKTSAWAPMTDPVGSPYIVSGNQWIGYDDERAIKAKADYVRSRGLGGAMMWAVGLDDVHGTCGPKRPLLRAINEGLGRIDSSVMDFLAAFFALFS